MSTRKLNTDHNYCYGELERLCNEDADLRKQVDKIADDEDFSDLLKIPLLAHIAPTLVMIRMGGYISTRSRRIATGAHLRFTPATLFDEAANRNKTVLITPTAVSFGETSVPGTFEHTIPVYRGVPLIEKDGAKVYQATYVASVIAATQKKETAKDVKYAEITRAVNTKPVVLQEAQVFLDADKVAGLAGYALALKDESMAFRNNFDDLYESLPKTQEMFDYVTTQMYANAYNFVRRHPTMKANLAEYFTVKMSEDKKTVLSIALGTRSIKPVLNKMTFLKMVEYLKKSRVFRAENQKGWSGWSVGYAYNLPMSMDQANMLDRLCMLRSIRKDHEGKVIAVLGCSPFEIRYMTTNVEGPIMYQTSANIMKTDRALGKHLYISSFVEQKTDVFVDFTNHPYHVEKMRSLEFHMDASRSFYDEIFKMYGGSAYICCDYVTNERYNAKFFPSSHNMTAMFYRRDDREKRVDNDVLFYNMVYLANWYRNNYHLAVGGYNKFLGDALGSVMPDRKVLLHPPVPVRKEVEVVDYEGEVLGEVGTLGVDLNPEDEEISFGGTAPIINVGKVTLSSQKDSVVKKNPNQVPVAPIVETGNVVIPNNQISYDERPPPISQPERRAIRARDPEENDNYGIGRMMEETTTTTITSNTSSTSELGIPRGIDFGDFT